MTVIGSRRVGSGIRVGSDFGYRYTFVDDSNRVLGLMLLLHGIGMAGNMMIVLLILKVSSLGGVGEGETSMLDRPSLVPTVVRRGEGGGSFESTGTLGKGGWIRRLVHYRAWTWTWALTVMMMMGMR
jgi:hypothetical protein